MINYLKYKINIALIVINIGIAWGFWEFFKNDNKVLLMISFGSFILHLLLYYFFVKRKETTPKS